MESSVSFIIAAGFLFFGSTKLIGKQRNEMVFTGDSNSREVVLHCSIAWARHFDSSSTINTPVHQNTHDQGHWKPPPAGWNCFNTDGGVETHSGNGSIGGVLRDSSGSWLGGFAKNIGVSTVLMGALCRTSSSMGLWP
ncbi:uncharacterized protein LOC120169281 [Hibiscus syriacus]|uniref:uncharacterized protein LOC120169281 n=1 Tax=Hibiscus syriacus TaxID=106335 RepID=UPI001922F066|nr:uncharacterized protein LOC120169281 [Hibiscus syriacus]